MKRPWNPAPVYTTKRTAASARWLGDKIFCHVHGEKVGDDVYPSMTKEAFAGLLAINV
jgi:hypothetical protein